MTKLPFSYNGGGGSGATNSVDKAVSQEAVKATMEGPFPTFWAVEDPLIVMDSVPRDLATASAKAVPTKSAFQMFETFELATQYAQRMNRPLLVLEMKVSAKVVPQLPLVEAVKAA